MYSLLIVDTLLDRIPSITTVRDCYLQCHTKSECKRFAHNAKSLYCMHFNTAIDEELISRLLYEGWTVGHILANGKIKYHVEQDSCTKTYCQDSCLKQVKEICATALYSGSDCSQFTGETLKAKSCRELLEIADQNPHESVGQPIPYELKENHNHFLEVEGKRFTVQCAKGLEYSFVYSADKTLCLKVESNRIKYTEPGSCGVFAFNRDTGRVFEQSYGETYNICPHYNSITEGQEIVHSTGCKTPTNELRLRRTGYVNTWQFENTYCLQPENYPKADGMKLELGLNCHGGYNNGYSFPNLPAGAVKVAYYSIGTLSSLDAMLTLPEYPDSPEKQGYVDDFASAGKLFEYYGIRMQAYFIAPVTGSYIFYAAADDRGRLFLSTDTTEENKKQIASVDGWTYRFQFNRHPAQKSAPQSLIAGKKYYLELIGMDWTAWDWFSVGMDLPDGTQIRPITYKYLERIE